MRRIYSILFVFCFMLRAYAEAPYLSDAQASGKTMDYEQLKIKSYKHWGLYLHENQCYLGRVFVLLKDEGIEDFLAIEGETREEFFQIGEHVHIIPRYKEAREFAGITFKDERWGKNYAPYDRSFVTEKSVLFQIRDALKENL